MMNNIKKEGQQEIVGFVLIVVLVVVGLMVFLVISLKSPSENERSSEVSNILDAIMKHTTECAIVYDPDYDNFEDLFKSCHQKNDCSNLDKSACKYLNESLRDVVKAMMGSEATVNYYQIDFFVKGETPGILTFSEGNCTGNVNMAQRNIISDSDSLVIRMKVCKTISRGQETDL